MLNLQYRQARNKCVRKPGCLEEIEKAIMSLVSLSIPAPLSSREQPLEVPQRKGCWSLWADSLKPRYQTDQQAGQHHTEKHTQNGETGTRRSGRGERKQINFGGEETLERGNKTEEVSWKKSGKGVLMQWGNTRRGRAEETKARKELQRPAAAHHEQLSPKFCPQYCQINATETSGSLSYLWGVRPRSHGVQTLQVCCVQSCFFGSRDVLLQLGQVLVILVAHRQPLEQEKENIYLGINILLRQKCLLRILLNNQVYFLNA